MPRVLQRMRAQFDACIDARDGIGAPDGKCCLEQGELVLEGSKILADAIMKLPGNPASFVFLHAQYRTRQSLEFELVALQSIHEFAIALAKLRKRIVMGRLVSHLRAH